MSRWNSSTVFVPSPVAAGGASAGGAPSSSVPTKHPAANSASTSPATRTHRVVTSCLYPRVATHMRTPRGVYAVAVDEQGVVLRPATADDLWLFERQAVDPEAGGTFNWSGFRDIRATRRRLDDNGLITPDGGCLMVTHGGAVVGTVTWTKVWYGIPIWWCWNIGISLLPDHRGRGIGTLAQQQLVAYLLGTSPAQRVEAYTDVENVAEQRALERAGFTREGVLRATQFRDGRWRDLIIYAVVR